MYVYILYIQKRDIGETCFMESNLRPHERIYSFASSESNLFTLINITNQYSQDIHILYISASKTRVPVVVRVPLFENHCCISLQVKAKYTEN